MIVLEGLIGLHRIIQLQLLQHCWLGHRFVLTPKLNSVVFEVASKYCILDSLVDYDSYSISSKGLLPTVVDVMVI